MSRSNQKVLQYLSEAHASEVALVRVLQSQIAMTPKSRFRTGLETHLDETRDHAKRLQARIGEIRSPNPLQAVVGIAETVVGQALALSKTPADLLRGTGGDEKVLKNAKDAAATEALEIATYTALEQLATSVGDEETARLAASIKADEEQMLARILREIPTLTRRVVAADVHGNPSFDVTETGAADAVEKTADAAKATADEVADTAKSTARKATSRAKSTATKAKARTKKAADSAKASATEAADEAKASASKATDKAKDTATKAGDRAKSTASDAADDAKGAARQTRKVPGVARAEGAAKGAVATASDLPFARYDKLTAEEIAGRLSKLSQVDLAKVDAYERRGDSRVTITDRISTLQADEPWPGYDELTAAEVRKALDAADADRKTATGTYERNHKARAAVLKAAGVETAAKG